MPHEKTFKQRVMSWVTPSLIITIGGILIAGGTKIFNAIIDQNKIMIKTEQKQFTSPEMRIKTEEHVTTPFNPVNVYIQGEKLAKQQVKVDTALAQIQQIIKEKEEDKKRVNKSRSARDSINRLILKKLEKLDSI